jgi:type IV secretory pathway TraG/TraD family ATPase VirD4
MSDDRENRAHEPEPLVVAPARSGKRTCFVIPHLLCCPHSMVVLDAKGDATVLAEQRRREFGGKIVILDPWGVLKPKPDSYNPLDFIDPAAPEPPDESRELGSVRATGNRHLRGLGAAEEPPAEAGNDEMDVHWRDRAEQMLAAAKRERDAAEEGEAHEPA